MTTAWRAGEFKPVVRGGRLGLAAPASPVDRREVDPGLERLEEMGFSLEWPNDRPGPFPYLAGSDDHRAEMLTEMMTDPEVDGVLCQRGGYGSLRTAARLDFDLLAETAKPLIGFSDITVLLSGLLKAGRRSIHGPSLMKLERESRRSLDRLADLLSGNWANTQPLPGRTLAGRSPAEGLLVGGNLTLLCHLIGTPWQPPSQGAIVFIEEVGEVLYRQDRCLTHLLATGFFRHCAGVAVGRVDGDDPERSEKLIRERLGGLNVPVVGGLPFGHQADNMALLVGAPARLDPEAGLLSPLPG